MKTPIRLSWKAAAALLVASSAGLIAQEYQVDFDFKARVGDAYRVRTEGSNEGAMAARRGGQTLQQRSRSQEWEFDGDVTITAVSKRQLPLRAELIVRRFTLAMNGSEKTLVPARTKVIASVKDGKDSFVADGQPVSPEATKMLKRVIDLDDGGMTNQQGFGPKTPKKVGDQWSADIDALIKDAKAEDLEIGADNIQAHTQFEKAALVDGKKALHFVITGKMKDVKPPLPDGVKITESEMSFEIRPVYPEDGSSPPLRESGKIVQRIVTESPQQPGVELEITETMTHKSRMTQFKRK